MKRPWRRPSWLLLVEVRDASGRGVRIPVPLFAVEQLLEDLGAWAWLADRWLVRAQRRRRPAWMTGAMLAFSRGAPLSESVRLARQLLRSLRQHGPFTLVDVQERTGVSVRIRLL